jgi:snRNA-activating protein complex subunit 3
MQQSGSAPSPYDPTLLDVSSLRIESPIVQIRKHIETALFERDKAVKSPKSALSSLASFSSSSTMANQSEQRFVKSMPKLATIEAQMRQLGQQHSAHFRECVANLNVLKKAQNQSGDKIERMAIASELHHTNAVQRAESTFYSPNCTSKSNTLPGSAEESSILRTKKALTVEADPSMLSVSAALAIMPEGSSVAEESDQQEQQHHFADDASSVTEGMEEDTVVEMHVFRAHCTGLERPLALGADGRQKRYRDICKLSQTLVFQPQMTLAAVRDAIYCLCDNFPDHQSKPSFFFIEGVFYSDAEACRGSSCYSDADTAEGEHSRIPVVSDVLAWQKNILREPGDQSSVSLSLCGGAAIGSSRSSTSSSSGSSSTGSASSNGTSSSNVTSSSNRRNKGRHTTNSSSSANSSFIAPHRAKRPRLARNHAHRSSEEINPCKHLTLQGFEEVRCKVVPMDSVSLQDLSVRLGAPYLYCHGYGCEHVISFTDLRVEKIDRSSGAAPYPHETFRRPLKRKFCDACAKSKAHFVMYGHPMAGKDPTYLCEPCYDSFNYDQNGKLVSQFKVYPYFHEL